MSNADVAALLRAKVILVTSGGIGKPIDEVLLNQSLFRDRGVELLGVVLNKVLPDKLEEVRDVVQAGLGRKGIDLLGCIPFEPLLANPTMEHVRGELEARVLNGSDGLHNIFDSVVVGAMAAPRAVTYVRPRCLLITPGDREDLLAAVLASPNARTLAGLLLTGGYEPPEPVVALARKAGLPVLLVEADSYSAAAAVHSLKVKILPEDTGKIAAATHLVNEYTNVDRIMERA
jgi:BioD-like phosphotransacetylase family protein